MRGVKQMGVMQEVVDLQKKTIAALTKQVELLIRTAYRLHRWNLRSTRFNP